MLLLLFVSVALARSKEARALALLPALAMLPVYALHRNATDRIEAVPALYSNFLASEGALYRLANAIESGENVTLPALTGRFQIIRGEKLDSGAIVLYTKEDGGDNIVLVWGFVRDEKQQADTGPASIVGMTGRAGENHSVKRLIRILFNPCARSRGSCRSTGFARG